MDRVDPGPAVMFACDLLVAGIDSEAVVALAVESPTGLSVAAAEKLLAALLRETGVPEPTTAEAVALVAADVCVRMLDRTLPVEAGGQRLLVVGHEDSGLFEVRDAVLSLLDRLEEEPADSGLRADLLAVARELHARLGGG